MASRSVALLDAPSNLGLREPSPGIEPGCRRFPDALRATGFLERTGAIDDGRVDAPPYAYDWNGRTVFNAEAIARYTVQLANRVGELLDDGMFPMLIGGDCSILLGPTLALRRRGRYGLVHLDGHSDFRNLANSPVVGAAAGEDLALVTGRGQDALVNIEGLRPYVRDEDAITIGDTDDPAESFDLQGSAIIAIDEPEVHHLTVDRVLATALERVDHPELEGFWIHLDVDILDSTLMPAVDSPHPGGLDWMQLESLLRGLLASPKATGIDITIFNPDLDPEGRLIAELADHLVPVLAG